MFASTTDALLVDIDGLIYLRLCFAALRRNAQYRCGMGIGLRLELGSGVRVGVMARA